jgi:hypothetical protein
MPRLKLRNSDREADKKMQLLHAHENNVNFVSVFLGSAENPLYGIYMHRRFSAEERHL